MNKFIVRISNEIGNQMFMYASTFIIAKKLNRTLLIDDDVENFSLSLLSLARNIERKRSDDGKETMTNISFFSIFY